MKTKTKSEKGITLIALLVMIILIVILAAITIRGLTGNEGLISVAETTAEDHKIATYKERIENNARATVVRESSTTEKQQPFGDIAEGLKEESDFIKEVLIDGEETDTERIHIRNNTRPDTYLKYTTTQNME